MAKQLKDNKNLVNEAFKKALDDKLVEGAKSPDTAAAHSRSRGAIFSRSRTSDSMRDLIDTHMSNNITDKLQTMDNAEFEKFAARLTKLKDIAKNK